MKTILVVDDEWDIANILEMIFSMEGYSVRIAYDGEQALERMKELPLPDIILCDIMMPKLDGYGFLDKLRQDSNYDLIPVILSSAARLDEKRIGNNRYELILRKPYDLTTLMDVIKKSILDIKRRDPNSSN